MYALNGATYHDTANEACLMVSGQALRAWSEPSLKFKTLHRNSIFAIENHLNLAT